jgi:hypothetical protein
MKSAMIGKEYWPRYDLVPADDDQAIRNKADFAAWKLRHCFVIFGIEMRGSFSRYIWTPEEEGYFQLCIHNIILSFLPISNICSYIRRTHTQKLTLTELHLILFSFHWI